MLTSIPELEMINRRRRPTKSISMADPIAITKLKIFKKQKKRIRYVNNYGQKQLWTLFTCKQPLITAFVSTLVMPTPSRTRLI